MPLGIQKLSLCCWFPFFFTSKFIFRPPTTTTTTHNSFIFCLNHRSRRRHAPSPPPAPQSIGWSVWWWCFMYHIVKVRAKMVLLRSFVVVGETRGELWFRSRKGGRWVDRTKGRQSTRRRRRRKTSLHLPISFLRSIHSTCTS